MPHRRGFGPGCDARFDPWSSRDSGCCVVCEYTGLEAVTMSNRATRKALREMRFEFLSSRLNFHENKSCDTQRSKNKS